MARKKQEIQLQRELETQEEWEECMAMEGLWVVDVYQEWCGPCQALQGNFKRLKNELGDNLLQFAIAKADTIDALEQYRGRCEPTFLFYCGGILVSFVHGANAPKVLRIVTEQLAHEHKVIEGQAERKEVKDIVMTRSQEKEVQQKEEEEANREAEAKKDCTVCIIKPDAVAAGKTDEIIAELTSRGIEILAQDSRELSDDEARAIYSELENEPFYNDLIKFICSGPSHVLVLTNEKGEMVIDDVRGLLGPKDVEEAKETEPDSLRAKYGDTGFQNGIHSSDSKETAARELAFFFPGLAIPTFMKKKENIQRTLAVIRPAAFAANKAEILQKIKEAGFKISLTREVHLTKEQAAAFYGEHIGQPYFDQLAEEMSSGPLMAIGMSRDEAITGWREMLGPPNMDDALEQAPNSMRALFTSSNGVNQLHGSDSEGNAKKDIDFFFPMEPTVAVVKPSGMSNKEMIIKKIHEAGFRIAARRETEITREIVDIMYASHMEQDYYEDLVNSLTEGNTLFMVLTKEGAVDGWRVLCGKTDPAEAKKKDPNSIRALIGQDILNNAVHASTNVEKAKELMVPIFGELKFNEDGTLKGQAPDLDSANPAEATENATAEQDESANATQDETAAEAPEGDSTVAVEETAADTTADDTTVVDTPADTAGDAAAETTAAEPAEKEATAEGAEATEATTEAANETTGEESAAEAKPEASDDAEKESTEAGETAASAEPTEEAPAEKADDKAEGQTKEPASDKTEQSSDSEKTNEPDVKKEEASEAAT